MLKIFQSHEWKCLIIDDFVPVLDENSRVRPLFTSLKEHNGDQLELWPLLLEKAYATVMGSYEEVHSHSLAHYFVHTMGLPLHKLSLSNDKKGWKEELKSTCGDCIVFGYSKIETSNGGDLSAPKRIVIHGGELASFHNLYTPSKTKVAIADLKRVFRDIFILRVNSLQFYTSSHICTPSRFGQNIKNKKCFNDRQILEVRREKPVVKTFKVAAHE